MAAVSIPRHQQVTGLLKIAWRADAWVVAAYYTTAVAGAAVPLAVQLLQQQLIDGFVAHTGRAVGWPTVLVTLLAARYVLGGVDGFVRVVLHGTTLDHLLRYRMQNAVALRFAEKLSALDLQHLEDPTTQNLIAKARDTCLWRTVDLLRMFAVLLTSGVGLLGALLLLIPFAPTLPLVLVIFAVPRLLLSFGQSDIHWSMWGSGAPEVKKLYYLTDLLSSAAAIPEIRIFGSAPALLERLAAVQHHLFALNKGPLLRLLRWQWFPGLLEGGIIGAVALWQLDEVLAGDLSLGRYVLLLGLSEAFLGAALQVAAQLAQIRENLLFAQHYFEVLALPRLVADPAEPAALPTTGRPPAIEFRDVCFAYPGGPVVLKGVSFVIASGSSVAFVGRNGAGKSTLIKLLCRFYDVDSGQILIDGVDLRSLRLSDWHALLGTLFQRFVAFHFTVRENVALGRPGPVDEARVRASLTRAGADFVETLPGGLDQLLGREFDDGVELSWGQWQKLAIARAFYQDPAVLVLDEPTSAVDAESEAAIFDALQADAALRTTVLVSHRFSTVRNADQILVIEDGRVVEQGDHAALVAAGGRYSAMYTAQARGFQEKIPAGA